MSKINSCIKNISVTDDDDDADHDECRKHNNNNNNDCVCDHTFIDNQKVNCGVNKSASKNAKTKNSYSDDNNNVFLNDVTKKVRRTFSIPKNPFRLSTKRNNNSLPTSLPPSSSINDHCKNILENKLNDKEIFANNQDKSSLLLSDNDYGKNDTMLLTTTIITTPQISLSPSSSALPTITKASTTSATTKTSSSIMPPSNKSTRTNGLIINDSNNKYRLFRRSTLKKMFTRIAQQMASVNIGVKQTMMPSLKIDNHRFPPFSGNINANGYIWQPNQIPGVTGLKNHGNTCFMNAVLQCLSHTDIIAEYFVLDQYKADLKKRNKCNAKKFGTKGELTEQLALVLKALWTCKNESDYSTSFKAVVDRYGAQFRSSTQHDAQEFLFWLLDKVHEDLNTASKRKYKSIKNNYGRSDEIIAAETLANHIRCNNSFVQAVFQAQFRSSLACPRCHKQSNTFDPFHCISVQLPQLAQQAVFVTVLYATQHPRQVKLGLSVPPGAPVIALREQLQADTGIPFQRIVLCEISDYGFTRVFCDSYPMSVLCENDSIYCIEVPASSLIGTIDTTSTITIVNNPNNTNNNNTAKVVDINDRPQLTLLITNVQRNKSITTPLKELTIGVEVDDVKRFGTPFCINVNRDISYTELQKRLLKEMQPILKSDLFKYTVSPIDLFKIRLQDPSADPDTYLDSNVEHPLFTEMIDLALSVLPTDVGVQHVKFLLEWNESQKYFIDLTDDFVEHESVSQLKEKVLGNGTLTLEQCLEHYTKAETLSTEDAWRCPHCQKYLPVVKTLGLWSLPDILVIHFKRFRQQHIKGPQAAKLTTTVKFPLTGFDMSPHMARDPTVTKQSSMCTHNRTENGGNKIDRVNPNVNENNQEESNNDSNSWKKIKKKEPGLYQIQHHHNHYIHHYNYQQLQQSYKDNRYDLYAVCYHQGDTLETGHYTAACKNPYDHHWYKYDDQQVSQVPDDRITEDIVNNEAYMLFYQRLKIDDNAECSAGSSSGSSINDHWVSKITMPPPPTLFIKPDQSVRSNDNKNLINSTTSIISASASNYLKHNKIDETLENVDNAENVVKDNETTLNTDDGNNLDVKGVCQQKQLSSSSTLSSNCNSIQSLIECNTIEVDIEINTKENSPLSLIPQPIVRTNVLSISSVTTTTSTVSNIPSSTLASVSSLSPGQIIKIEKTNEDEFIDIENVENNISIAQINSIEIDNILGTEISSIKQIDHELLKPIILPKNIETKLYIMNNHNTDVTKCNDHYRNGIVNGVTTIAQTGNVDGNINNSFFENITRKNENSMHVLNEVHKDMIKDDFNEVELRNLTEKIEETLSKSFPTNQQSHIWPIYNNRGSLNLNDMLSYHKLKQCDIKNSYNNNHNINNSKQTTNIDFQNLRQSLLSSTSSSIQLPSSCINNTDTSIKKRYYSNHHHNQYRNHQANDKQVSSAAYTSIIRGTNLCSKDTLLFVDQQNHNHHTGNNNIIDYDESVDGILNDHHRHDSSYLENRSLWISPVTPHKLITVSPKN